MASYKFVVAAIFVICVLNSATAQQQNTPNESSIVESARTFGRHFLKRISFAIIPAAFVIGAVTTLLAAITVTSMNGLGVGVSTSVLFYKKSNIQDKLSIKIK